MHVQKGGLGRTVTAREGHKLQCRFVNHSKPGRGWIDSLVSTPIRSGGTVVLAEWCALEWIDDEELS